MHRRFAILGMAWLVAAGGDSGARRDGARPSRWPLVARLDTTLHVTSLDTKTLVRLPIRDQRGALAYDLDCRGGSAPYVPEAGGDDSATAAWGAWALVCSMPPAAGSKVDDNILVGDEGAPWHDPSWIWYSEIVDPKQQRHEYRLRALDLTLSFSHVVPKDGTLSSVDMRVQLRPDPAARTTYVDLGRPRLCRNWEPKGDSPSWFPCPVQ